MESSNKSAHALPTRRIAFPKQLELLRGYAIEGSDGRSVQNREVARLVGMNFKTTSSANAFFLEVGFIHRTEGGNVPAAEVTAFQHAFQWNPDQAPQELAPIVERSWFAAALTPKLKFKPLTEDEALAILSREARVGPKFRPELKLLLDYLEAPGLIVRDGSGQVQASDSQTRPTTSGSEPPKRDNNETGRPQEAVAAQPSPARGTLPLLIQGLLEQLPKDGRWRQAERDQWVQMVGMAVDVVYKVDSAPDSASLPPEQPEAPDV